VAGRGGRCRRVLVLLQLAGLRDIGTVVCVTPAATCVERTSHSRHPRERRLPHPCVFLIYGFHMPPTLAAQGPRCDRPLAASGRETAGARARRPSVWSAPAAATHQAAAASRSDARGHPAAPATSRSSSQICLLTMARPAPIRTPGGHGVCSGWPALSVSSNPEASCSCAGRLQLRNVARAS
jgi:hypothetical protein